MPIAVNQTGEAVYLTPEGKWEPATVAENPQTKERLAYDGKDWQPIKAPASKDYSAGDVGMAAVRGIPIAGGVVERMSSPESQAGYKNFDEQHPWISGAAKLGGGVAALGPLGMTAAGARALGMTGNTLLRQVGNSAVSGAAIGGADALTRGEDIKTGAELGGAFGIAGPLAGRAIGAAFGGAQRLAPVSRAASNFEDVGGVRVPLDRGQATGDVVTQRYLESAQKGVLGPGAQQEADAFRAIQAQATERAKGGIKGAMGGADATPLEAADIAQMGVQQRAAAAKGAATAKYDEFGAMQGSVKPSAFDGVAGKIEIELANAKTPMFVSPVGRAALGDLEKTLQTNALTNSGAGVSIQGIDHARKQLLARARALGPMEGADKALMGKIVERFDDHTQNVLGSALYSGDPAALGTIKDARRLWAEYSRTFKGQGTVADNVVQNMLGKNGNPADHASISNWMYGASKIGGHREANLVAQKLKGILGETSQEWQAVRQGLFSKLVDSVEGKIPDGPQKISQRVFEFLNGSGKQLADEVFDQQTRTLIAQYGSLMKRLTPVPGAVNHSNSGYQVASMLKWTANALAMGAGLHVGGPLGALAGVASNTVGKGLIEGQHTRAVLRNLYNPSAAPLYPALDKPALTKGGALLGRAALGL